MYTYAHTCVRMYMHRCMCIYICISTCIAISTCMGACQNYGPPLGPLNTRCRVILRTPKRDKNLGNHPYYESVSTSVSISPFNMDSQKGTIILPQP